MGLFDKQKPLQDDTQQAAWLADRARIASFLYRARTFNGTGPEDPTLSVGLRNGERALLVATGTFLVDPRRVQAHWAGVSGGFSFHVPQQAVQVDGFAAGPGPDVTPVDTGDLTFTDQRIVFAGQHQSREWEYSALLGFQHADHPPWTAMAVSGQDRVSGFRYDEGQAGEIRFAIVLGLARFHNALDSLIADLQEQLDEFDRAHSPAAATGPAQTWQTQPAPGAAPQEGVAGSFAPAGMPIPTGAVGGTMAAASAATAWPPTNPFGAAPAAGAAATPAAPGPVTWNADPAQLAPTGPGTSVPETIAQPTATLPAESGPAESGPAESGPAESGPADIGAGAPEAAITTNMPTDAAPPAGSEPEPPAEPSSVVQAEPEPAQAQPAASAETGVPTGEIPAVPLSPTATYPAVAQQPVMAAQPYQSAQPMQQAQPQAQTTTQAAPSTPPGWYPDPWRVARVRWWDGYSWTSYTSH